VGKSQENGTFLFKKLNSIKFNQYDPTAFKINYLDERDIFRQPITLMEPKKQNFNH